MWASSTCRLCLLIIISMVLILAELAHGARISVVDRSFREAEMAIALPKKNKRRRKRAPTTNVSENTNLKTPAHWNYKLSALWSVAAGLCNRTGTDEVESSANSKLLFLHIFKAAGSTTRETLKNYASKCNLSFVTSGNMCTHSNQGFLCLRNGKASIFYSSILLFCVIL